MSDKVDEKSVFEEQGRLTEQEITKIRSVLDGYPLHNHDGRNSQKVATKTVQASIKSEQIRPNTSAVAGENLDNGNGARIGEEDSVDDLRTEIFQTNHGSNTTEVFRFQVSADFSQRAAQSFTTGRLSEKFKSVVWEFNGTAGAPNNITWYTELRADNNGEPGSLIATSTARTNDVAFDVDEEFVFSIQDLEPETKYWIVCKSTATLIVGGVEWAGCRRADNDTGYEKGTGLYSNDNGSTWTPLNVDHYFKIKFADTGGRIYKSNASTSALAKRTIGVSNKTVLKGQTPEIISYGNKTDFTNLSTGEVYYITDTRGELTTSPGTVEKQIGLALDTNNLFITL